LSSYESFVHLLRSRAEEDPARRLFTYLDDGERAETCVTYAELDTKARAVAAMLQASFAPGARIVLLYPPGIDYVAAFFGCLYGGFVAVPAYPPDPSRLNRTLPRLQAIISDARAEVVLTTSMIAGMAEMLAVSAPDLAKLRWIATDTLDRGLASDWKQTLPDAATLAFLQYTSGSTGTPKGVMLTHGNLLANERSIQSVFKLTRESVGVGWLPLYHDMGLIGNVLQTVYAGFHCVLMSPLDFLHRPFRWLDAISRYGGTTSGGPNFAYELCVRKITPEERATLDLRSWTLAFSGAEPVRRACLDRFAEAFAECGFRREAFLPCYGLAEATLLVTGKSMGTDYRVEHVDAKALEDGRAVPSHSPEGAREIVSCGVVPEDTSVVIVDPETRFPRPAGQVGELWVAGPHVAIGYWDDAAKTAEVFGATLASDGSSGYLRTGDLAFLHDGEIFVCGRLKDLIIVRGKNYYPQDIERAAESSSRALRQGGAAAFSVQVDGEERVVLAAEIVRADGLEAETVFGAVRRGVSEDSSLHLHAVVLVRPGSIPKTSSGKIQRHAARAAYLDGTLDVVASSALEDDAVDVDVEETPLQAPIGLADLDRAADASRCSLVERYLAAEIARVLRAAPGKVDLDAPLASLGLDSLMAIDVTHAVERTFGIVLPATALLREGTGRALAEKIVALVGRKSEETPADAADVDGTAEFPLSAGQEALWVLQGLTGETSAYNVGTAFSVRGELDVDVLAASLRALLERNDALTATFTHTAQALVQRTDPARARSFRVELVDASGLDDQELRRLAGDEVYRPLDLEHGPVFRVTLLTRGPGWHVLVLAAHHIAADLWSLVILLSELRAVYAALRAGQPVPELPPRARYREFVAWQKSYLEREAATDWAYWRTQLEGVPPLEVPTDRPRPAVQTYGGAAAPIGLSPDLVNGVVELARREGTTPFVVLLVTFEILLARASGQESFLVGSPAAGRPRASFERTAGYFVNPVPLRADLSGDPTARALLRRVREGVLAGLEHQSFPFTRAVERLSPVRDPSRSPLFQALFVLEKAYLDDVADLTMLAMGAGRASVDFAGLEMGPFPVGKRTERFDLTLSLAHGEGRIGGALEYNTSLFEPDTAARLASHFVTLLESLLATPDEIVWRLPMMTAAERTHLLVLFRGERAPNAADAAVHELFEAEAARTPNALAVARDAEELTYGELNRRANQLASVLRQDYGVGVESRVVTCFERSPVMIVADLAAMKAGGAFVPMDPSYPPARALFVAQDSGAKVVLTTSALAARLREGDAFASGPPIVAIDDSEVLARVARAEATDVPRRLHPRAPAYVVYTSGTTGKPKGVVIEHTQLVAMSRWVHRHYALGPSDRLSQTAGPAFDASVFEIVPGLLVGASLHIVDDETRRSPEALRRLVIDRAITICFVPTPLAEQLLDETDWKAAKLRYLQSGGDRLTRRPGKSHPFVLINGYGPSECTVQSTVAAVAPSAGGRAPTIGRPIDGVQVYVLDARLEPLPIGVPGELFVGGSNVGRGYGGQPSLTASRFLPDPFSAEAGARMYRTGDLARFLANGELEFIGRADHQVKIHGHRIELGEIESALMRQPAVREAVVLAREDVPGKKRLVAYVTERDSAMPPDSATLAAKLRAELPEYMVPSAFVVMAALPLTTNGKVDRAALPAPAATAEGAADGPRGELEERLCALAAEVLGVPSFGLSEKFFEAGASSLDLVKLQKRFDAELGLRVPLTSFFEYPSIGALAPHVRSLQVAKERGLGVDATDVARAIDVHAPARRDASTPIAIIGMAGRFPGAADVHSFWANVLAGRDCIARFDAKDARRSPLVPEGPSHPRFLGAEGVLEATGTDPELWRPAADTRGLDLQSRLFLDTVLAAFEDAGHDPWSGTARISVYGGASPLPLVEALADEGLATRGSALWALGTVAPDTLPMRVAHTFGFRGEAMNVNTACSTGLAVVHLARQSLLGGNSDLAVAVAANVPTVQGIGYVHEEGTILSKDGVVRPFDAEASGVVLGRGVAAVLLKPLDAALRDGDAVYAVLRGTASNNDGLGKVGYTAPSVEGQVEVIAAAHDVAQVAAREVDYVETHGTGTRLGDPVELSALTRAFRRANDDVGYCALGAVKANIGHLDTVAGLAGLVKTVLALHHETLPPLSNFTTPNPELHLETTPFTVPTEARPWPRGKRARIAGVSSFGIGGTNVHAVVEEAPLRPASTVPSRAPIVLTIGSRTEEALDVLAGHVAARLEGASLEEACDVAYTLNTRRLKWPRRRAVVGVDGPSLARVLRDEPRAKVRGGATGRIAFVFAGMGGNPAGLGKTLYREEAAFREHVDACQTVLLPAGFDVHDALTRQEPGTPLSVGLSAAALFTFETALARVLIDWGIKPSFVIGHSFGEYAALLSSGGLTLSAALDVVRVRCRAMESMPTGAMLMATSGEADAEALARENDVEIAAFNGPRGTVFSGTEANITRLQAALRGRRIAAVRLGVDRALHSKDVEPVLPQVSAAFDAAGIQVPDVPFVSTVTGGREEERLAAGAYWAEQMRRPVRFADALRTAQAAGASTFVEIGPSGGLVPAMASALGDSALCQPTLQGTADARSLYALVARLLAEHVEVDWSAWYSGETRRRVPTPLHPRPAAVRSEQRPVTEVAVEQPQVVVPVASNESIEARVSALWKRALNLDTIDPRAHFLELGGSSLLAVQLVASMRDEFRVDIGLAEVFTAPTVEELTRLIAARLPETPVAAASAPVAPVAPLAAPPSGVLSAVQKRVLAADGDPMWSASVVNMAGAVRLRGPLDVQRMTRALRDVVRRHEAIHTRFLRRGAEVTIDTRFRPSDVQLASVWCDAEDTEARLGEVRTALAERIEQRLDVTHEIPLRAFLFPIGENDHVLGLVVHHLAMDAPSLKVLLQDTLASYLGVPLGEHGPSYAAFAARQAAEIASEQGAAHAAWQEARIDGSPRLRGLLGDARRADATITFELGPEIGQAVAELQKKRGVSTFVALASAVALTFADAFGTRELVVSTPYGNRERADHTALVGYVAHCMVMPIDLNRGMKGEGGLVSAVGHAFAEALRHASVPFEHAVLSRGASGARPFSDVCLVVHEELEQTVTLGDLVVDPFSHEVPGQAQPPVWAGTMGTVGFLVHWRPDSSGGRVTFCYPQALVADAATTVPRRLLDALRALIDGPRAALPAASSAIATQPAKARSPLALRLDGVALSADELEGAVEAVATMLRAASLPARAVVDVVARNRAELVVLALGVLRVGGSATIGRTDTSFVLTVDDSSLELGAGRRLLQIALDIPRGRSWSAPSDALAAPIGKAAVDAAETRIGAAHVIWDERLPDNRALPFALAALGGGGLVSELRIMAPTLRTVTESLPLSLAYFPVDEERYDDQTYRLLIEGAKAGDDAGLRGLFVPERHFHPFGGTFPDPLVAAAALATATKTIQLRAGSIVLPLHDPLRVAESWAMVDVMSGGRVGLSIATGWRAEDFVLAPERYSRRKEELTELLQTVRALWRGESIERIDPLGRPLRLRTRPRPIQPELPVWLTCAGSPASFALAGELGASVLTMLATDLDGLRDNIAAYRSSFAKHWHGAHGHVTVLASTFIDDDAARAREIALPALERYMGWSLDIGMKESGTRMPLEAQRRFLRQKAERVADADGLVGDVDECRRRLAKLADAGADEIACLVDFGVDHDEALRGIPRIADLGARAPALSARWPRLPAAAPLEHRALPEVWLMAASSTDAVAAAPHRTVLVEDVDLPPVTAECIHEHPLAAIQFGIYFDELRFARATYNNPFLVHSKEALEPARLEDAIAAACRRHDMLRSRFVARDNQVLRVIDLEPLVELRTESDAVDEAAVVARARQDSTERFDLGRVHPLRAHLYPAQDGGSYLMLCVHHIAGDVVSGFIALRDVMRAYHALPGDAFAGEAAPPSYADVLAKREAGSKDRDKRLSHWLAQIEGVKPVLEWPSSTSRPPRLTGEGAEISRLLPKPHVERLRTAAARSRVTVPTFLFAVLQALLHLKTRRRDLVVGSVTLGRSDPSWLEVVGPFFNMLPVRSSLEPGLGFDKLAQRSAVSLLHAMTEDEIGVAEIVQDSKVKTTLDRSPLVQFIYNYIPKQGVGDGADSGIAQIDVDWGIATFDVDVTARERGDDLLLSVKYSKDALDEAEADGFLHAFERLLERVTEDPAVVLLPADAPATGGDGTAFWERELSGATRGITLPVDPPSGTPPSGPRDREPAPSRITSALSPEVSASLAALAQQRSIRLSSVYLAALAVFLERHSGQRDLLIASWTSASALDAVVGVPGAFTPVRVQVGADQPFVEIADAVDRTLTTAAAAEPLTAAEIFGDGGKSAGVGVAFGWVEGSGDTTSLPPRTSLALVVSEGPSGPSLTLLHAAATFGAETIARFEERLRVLLHSLATAPLSPVSTHALLPAAEREQLRAWNKTDVTYPKDARVHELVAAHARTSPGAIAVVDERTQLTYGELDARAERLGGRLRDAGVAPESRVAVALPRNVEMVVALLGIQKSGAAYVPIDLSLPRERVRMMLEDAGVTHVVTDGESSAILPETTAKRVRVDVDETPTRLASAWPGAKAAGDALAYVIFTSGSTGRPKGVAVSHGALVNFLCSMQREPGISRDDVLLAVTTLSFDISGLELYGPLVAGGRVVLASREAALDGRRLAELMTSQGVTIFQATPTTYRLLLATGWQGSPTFKALVGGESVPADLVAELVPRCGSVWNMYGPTETTIWSTCARLDGSRVIIGRPIANTQVFVLGPSLERMPIGMKGELYIGGDGLARGYLDQPALTAERFILNPLPDEGSARLYRTGDIARMLPDGNLECFGRVDTQVKVRGFRIELAEIEHALTKIPSVKAGVVLLRDGGPAGPRLIAYVVGRSRTTELAPAELADALKAELPVYMVPSAFVVLPALPLNPSGKVDRNALLALDVGEHTPTQTEYEVPSGDLETIISALWSEALGVPKVGRNDNFFDLGGHSLLALQIHGKLVQKLGKDFPILNLFTYTTVASLAQYLSGMDTAADTAAAEARDTQLERGVERLAQRRNRRRR
jgi:amino acid adenylation domain-containing protein/natural product biosynthesis luciferase-like monooxygenase protein